MNNSVVISKAGVGAWQCAKFPILMKICSKTQTGQDLLARLIYILSHYPPLRSDRRGVPEDPFALRTRWSRTRLLRAGRSRRGEQGERDKELLPENNKWLPERWENFFQIFMPDPTFTGNGFVFMIKQR
jgi:hypothetical protein